jgi:transposase
VAASVASAGATTGAVRFLPNSVRRAHRDARGVVTQLLPLLDRIPYVVGRPSRPRPRPALVLADRGYDYDKHRRLLCQRGIDRRIARRQTEHGSGLGHQRWVVERTLPGSANSDGSPPATSAATTPTKHSSASAAA